MRREPALAVVATAEPKDKDAECERMVERAIEELKQAVVIQHELLCRLLDEQYPLPLNLAEALEDAANRLLDFSEGITQRNLAKAMRDVWLVD